MDSVWGIDLGGTKIEGVVIDLSQANKVISRKRVATEQEFGYQHILQQIAKLVDMLVQDTGIHPERIGMGTPGVTDPSTGGLKNCNTVCLIGKPLQADLEKLLGVPFVLANDANCFALAEATMGVVPEQVPKAKVVFGVIMGTGVGSGIVVNGKVLNGLHGIAGEWGHNFLDESGGDCYCGKQGCVETVISGPASERYYQSLTGEHKKLKEIMELYNNGTDVAAVHTIDHLLHMFGKAISTIINILDPDAIVLGGGVGNIDQLYTHGVGFVKKYLFNDVLQTPFLKPKLGDSAGVFGAAMLVAN